MGDEENIEKARTRSLSCRGAPSSRREALLRDSNRLGTVWKEVFSFKDLED